MYLTPARDTMSEKACDTLTLWCPSDACQYHSQVQQATSACLRYVATLACFFTNFCVALGCLRSSRRSDAASFNATLPYEHACY